MKQTVLTVFFLFSSFPLMGFAKDTIFCSDQISGDYSVNKGKMPSNICIDLKKQTIQVNFKKFQNCNNIDLIETCSIPVDLPDSETYKILNINKISQSNGVDQLTQSENAVADSVVQGEQININLINKKTKETFSIIGKKSLIDGHGLDSLEIPSYPNLNAHYLRAKDSIDL